MIGRLGRSLHIHLLLASQRLEEGKLRGLDSHLSYRIGLKTFSAGESRSVLGVPDAYHLPSVPGSAFLKCDADEPIRFNASYVSGEYVKPRVFSRTGRTSQLGVRAPKLFTATPVEKDPTPAAPVDATCPTNPKPDRPSGPTKTTLLDVVVGRLRGHGRPAHEVWLPPLEDSPAVNVLLPDSTWTDPQNVNGRLLVADRRGGPSLRPAPRRTGDRPLRCPRQRRGGRRSAIGQVHRNAHAHHGGCGHPHPRATAVLLPGLRWRHPGQPDESAARRQRRRAHGRRPHSSHRRRGHRVAAGARVALPRPRDRVDARLPATQGTVGGDAAARSRPKTR